MRDVMHGSSAAVLVLVLVLAIAVVLGIALPLLYGGRPATNWTPSAPTPTATQMPIPGEATQRPAGTSKLSAALNLNSTPIASWSKVRSTPTPVATETPISVPSPTATIAPTLQPSATANTAPIPAGPARPATTPVGFAVAPKPPALVEPGPDDRRRGRVTFTWQPNGPLLLGTAYEVVWWNRNEDPNSASRHRCHNHSDLADCRCGGAV